MLKVLLKFLFLACVFWSGLGLKVEASEFLYFLRFKASFHEGSSLHFCETIPGALALHLRLLGLRASCEFFGQEEKAKQSATYLGEGLLLKDSQEVLRLQITLRLKKTDQALSPLFFQGTSEVLWKQIPTMVTEIAKLLSFYVDPLDLQKLQQLNLSLSAFQHYLKAVQEESLLNFLGAALFYQKALEIAPDFKIAKFQRLKCLYRSQQLNEFSQLLYHLEQDLVDYPEVLYLKARQDYQDGESFRAKHWIRRALSEDGSHLESKVTQICLAVFENQESLAKKEAKALYVYHEKAPILYFVQLLLLKPDETQIEKRRHLLQEGLFYLEDEDPWVLHVAAKAAQKHGWLDTARELLWRAKRQSAGYAPFIEKELQKLEKSSSKF
jgi:hypothetical protein